MQIISSFNSKFLLKNNSQCETKKLCEIMLYPDSWLFLSRCVFLRDTEKSIFYALSFIYTQIVRPFCGICDFSFFLGQNFENVWPLATPNRKTIKWEFFLVQPFLDFKCLAAAHFRILSKKKRSKSRILKTWKRFFTERSPYWNIASIALSLGNQSVMTKCL